MRAQRIPELRLDVSDRLWPDCVLRGTGRVTSTQRHPKPALLAWPFAARPRDPLRQRAIQLRRRQARPGALSVCRVFAPRQAVSLAARACQWQRGRGACCYLQTAATEVGRKRSFATLSRLLHPAPLCVAPLGPSRGCNRRRNELHDSAIGAAVDAFATMTMAQELELVAVSPKPPQPFKRRRAKLESRSTRATSINVTASRAPVSRMWNSPMWKLSICPRPPPPTTPSTAAARMLFSQR